MGPQVMIVDEDPCVRAVVSSTLSRLGYDTRCADDSHDALGQLALYPADVVITELFMPQVDGIDLVVALRAQGRAQRILALSAGGESLRMAALQTPPLLGADAVLEKPLSMSALVRIVGELVDAGGSERPESPRSVFGGRAA